MPLPGFAPLNPGYMSYCTASGTRSLNLRIPRVDPMRAFLVGCLAAAVIAICAVGVLNMIQEPVTTAFSTSAVRI
jgi:hypothetical protein